MGYLALYWSFMVVGYIVAAKLRKANIVVSWIQTALVIVIYVLCFIMGLRMGINEQVILNLGVIGIKACIISVASVGGSIGSVILLRKVFRMNKYGDIVDGTSTKHGETEKYCEFEKHGEIVDGKHELVAFVGEDEASDRSIGGDKAAGSDNQDLRFTIIIVALVVAGMLAGYLIIYKMFAGLVVPVNELSEMALTVLLCVLLFFVGFDMGGTGTLFAEFKKVGLKVIGFPFAAVVGTAVLGTVSCMLLGLSLKEGMAVSLGFGWYTYAPVVIANAGEQYIIVSAISFMHNVIRELGGIIFIPLIARKIGFIESATVPGVAAMDVCLPIVGRACRQDTMVYSFAIGFLMCIATSAGVPLVMGL